VGTVTNGAVPHGRVRDVIVVGGGHNGLACATYLARAGLDVLVLERRDKLGGPVVTDEPWPGYQVSTASYVMSLMPPKVVDELELHRHGYETTILAPDYYVPYTDGTALTLWGDARRTADEIAKFNKADAEAYLEFDTSLARYGELLHDLMFVVPPNLRLGELPHWAAIAAKLRRWSGRDIADIVRLFTISAADLLDEWFDDERVKGALGTQAILGAWTGPMCPGSAYVLVHHWFGEIDGQPGAWAAVKGGMSTVSNAIAAAAREAGAEIRSGVEVRRVVVSGDGASGVRADGVELADGTMLRAARVVSNAHPQTTYLDLVGEANLPPDAARDIRRYRTRSGSVKVNLALSTLPRPPAWQGPIPGDPHTGIMAISPSIEYLERAWDDAKYGRCSEGPYIEIVFPTALDPAMAPAGKHLALCFTQFAPQQTKQEWDAERDRYGARVIDTVDRYCPGFAASVEHVEVLGPHDLEERYGLLGGSISHGDMSPDQMFSFRPIPGYGDYRSPVKGLYLCGAGTHPGGGVMGVSGRNCATVVAKDAGARALVARLRTRRRR
jgi:phytoene dehydrogenase-like protein